MGQPDILKGYHLRKYIKQTDISKKTEVIPMGQEAELSLISYFGRYEVIDEIDNNLHMAEDKSAEEM